MQKPTTYTGIRAHAWSAYTDFTFSPAAKEPLAPITPSSTILERLYHNHISIKPSNGLDDATVASECADHLLAGIDTTSDTALFLIWALSRPQNAPHQTRLIKEVLSLPSSALDVNGIPTVESVDRLPFLDAVIRETLRLYTPLPSTEPRRHKETMVVDGVEIPPGTVVGSAPFSLHRNAEVFAEPLLFEPRRWLDGSPERMAEMKKWWWAFSSGGRMCIGIQ
jgi:cytochrome P450